MMGEDLAAAAMNPNNHVPIDTVLIDYEMPVLNGPDATEKLRAMGFQAAIFGVTGNVMKEDVEFFLSKGADRVVSKPISMAALNGHWQEYDTEQRNGNNGSPVGVIEV